MPSTRIEAASQSRRGSAGASPGQASPQLPVPKIIGRDIEPMVDAGMDEEATRLQALHLQAELAIQVLNIANGATRNILALFR
jgi:hypothetical protein